MSDGMRALLLVAGSALAGLGYVLYIKAEPFPPAVARLVPMAWLAGSVQGGCRAARTLRHSEDGVAAGLAFALHVPSAILAAIFSLGALMGD